MSVDEEMREALATYITEAADLLAEFEGGLLDLEGGAGDDETVNSVFRAAHTLKGSAGLFGLGHIVGFTHVIESVLDRVRVHEVAVSPELVGILLPCKDHLGRLIAAVGAGRTAATDDEEASGALLLSLLEPYLAAPATPAGSVADAPALAGPEAAPGRFYVSLRFGSELLRSGMDPISFIRYLSTVGSVEEVRVFEALIPDAEEMDPEQSYLAFGITLRTDQGQGAVEEVFDFVREDSDIRVLTAADRPAAFRDLIESYGPASGAVAGWLPPLAGDAPEPDTEDLSGADELGRQLVAVAAAGDPTSPLAAGPTDRAAERSAESRTLRIDASRLDRLIDTVGELVIAGAGAGLRVAGTGDDHLKSSIGEVMRLVEEVRDDALRLRMVPIGTTFSRFQRVVRDIGASLGKDVALVISGGETEVDKALVEHVGDPLMHLVRNAMDHGIESEEARVACGKPARGTLRLRAYHDSGSIVVVVEDDGAGIDPARVFAKAVERGLVDAGASLSTKEINELIFEPGFSTADQVSDLSGRGVGMDVVKRNVAALRGTIEVDSELGAGTTVRIRLPLTLAIIDGFLVGVGGSTYVIPLDRVVECVGLPPGRPDRDFMDLRDEVLPLARLRPLMGVDGEPPRRENVVVVEHAGVKTGLVVDTLQGEFQTVIKPLGALFEHVEGIGGSTILGNGDVALIIDVPMLVRRVTHLAGARGRA